MRLSAVYLTDKTEEAIEKNKNSENKEMIPICHVRIRRLMSGVITGVRIFETFPEGDNDIIVMEIFVNEDGDIVIKSGHGTIIKACKHIDEIFYLFAMVVKHTNKWHKEIKKKRSLF